MSLPLCPECKQPNSVLTKVTNAQNAQNPNRAYYICQQCPGKDGKGTKFLGWVDGKNSFKGSREGEVEKPPTGTIREQWEKKRKFDSDLQESSPSPMEVIIEKLNEMKSQIDQIHQRLKLIPVPPEVNFDPIMGYMG